MSTYQWTFAVPEEEATSQMIFENKILCHGIDLLVFYSDHEQTLSQKQRDDIQDIIEATFAANTFDVNVVADVERAERYCSLALGYQL